MSVLTVLKSFLIFFAQDEMVGNGTGKLHGKQLFVCRKHFAVFLPIEGVIPEEDFDENPVKPSILRTYEKCDDIQEQIRRDEALAKSLNYDASSSGNSFYKIL